MKRTPELLPMLLLLVVGCQTADDTDRLVQFEIPVIRQPELQPGTKPAALRVDSITPVFNNIFGRFRFAKTLTLRQPDSIRQGEFFLEPSRELFETDSLSTDGLELISDYKHDLTHSRNGRDGVVNKLVYPVYIVNSTPRTKLLCGKNSWAFGIQEAKDRQGYWRPIESRAPDFCGNGEWALKLRPRQVAVLLVNKYQGNYKTLLRVRLQNGNSRYVSAPFEGWINETQFLATKWQWRQLQDDKLAVNYLYHGATPAALDSLEARAYRAEMAHIPNIN